MRLHICIPFAISESVSLCYPLKCLYSLQVFFPVIKSKHFYVICFNFRLKNVVILDNSDVVDDEPFTSKYDKVPHELVNYANISII